MIAVEFARFPGLPLTRRSNVTDVLEAVCGVCTPGLAGICSRPAACLSAPPVS
ncbi:MAG: hypothetical protein ACRDNT_02110 [Streptosporangiaceae bacterium]